MDSKNIGGDQPAKNHQFAQVPYISAVNAKAFDRYVAEHRGCYACPIKCSRDSEVLEGAFAVEAPPCSVVNGCCSVRFRGGLGGKPIQ